MKHSHTQSGFTLIETIIAILILVLTIGALLTLTAGGFFTIRYIKNDIVAGNLIQESLEYVRNTRDNAGQAGTTWEAWYQPYVDAGCMDKDGCIVNPYTTLDGTHMVACSGTCPYMMFFPGPNFYGYDGNNTFGPATDRPYETSFIRTIKMELKTADAIPQMIVTSTIEWMNSANKKSATQSVVLTPWNL